MLPVLTPEQMQAVDRQALEHGVTEQELITRAGTAVAWHARRMLGGTYGRRVVVVCGKGNNGNDGRVAARVLARWGVHVDRFDVDDRLHAHQLRRALSVCDLAVDAMFGTGFRGELEGVAALIDGELYRAPKILAVDIPSGVDGLTGEIRGSGFVGGAVLADETITFAALKPGLLFEPGRFHAGLVTVIDIGLDVSDHRCHQWTAADAAGAPLERWPHEHKWSSAVMVVGGSRGMTGAPMLAAKAAQRAGAGMVVAAMPGTAALAESGSEIVTQVLATTAGDAIDDAAVDEIVATSARFHVVIVGPGLGRSETAMRLVRSLVEQVNIPLVIDADALHALADDGGVLERRWSKGFAPVVLTPHAGEYAALTGGAPAADRVAATREVAAATGCVVLLKGPATVVCSPDGETAIVSNAGSELATAGTGDALCGVIGALMSSSRPQNASDVFSSVASAAWIHGDAGRRTEKGPSMIASDLLETLPLTINALRQGEAS